MHKRALYAGSFDPLTYGHYDIIKRAAELCDELIVGVLCNPSKVPFFSIEERVKMIGETLHDIPNVKIEAFDGLLVDFVIRNDIDVVVRGLRCESDFEYEIHWSQMNARFYKKHDKNVESVFLMTDPKYSFISSSSVKEIFGLGASAKGLVPDNILKYMEEKKRFKEDRI